MNYYSASRDPEHTKKETIVQIDAREAIFGAGANANSTSEGVHASTEEGLLLERAVQTKYIQYLFILVISFQSFRWEKSKVSWVSCDPYI